MNRLKITLILILSLVFVAEGYSQRGTVIRGRIIDKSDQVAVIGATIIEYDKDDQWIHH